jgi:hypothetical protein
MTSRHYTLCGQIQCKKSELKEDFDHNHEENTLM